MSEYMKLTVEAVKALNDKIDSLEALVASKEASLQEWRDKFQVKPSYAELERENARFKKGLEDVVMHLEGSTCECGIDLHDIDAADSARKALSSMREAMGER
jgi:hypothetical protein